MAQEARKEQNSQQEGDVGHISEKWDTGVLYHWSVYAKVNVMKQVDSKMYAFISETARVALYARESIC